MAAAIRVRCLSQRSLTKTCTILYAQDAAAFDARARVRREQRVRYAEFCDAIEVELRRNPTGLTWAELKQRLNLPYDRPCPTRVRQMGRDVGLSRAKGTGRGYLWKVRGKKQGTK